MNLLQGVPNPQRRAVDLVREIALEKDCHPFLVGGPVRDILLGRHAIDIDLTLEHDASTLAGNSGSCVVDLAEGATVDELFARLRDIDPDLAPALRSALPVVAGEHVPRDRRLADRDQVALLLPVSGG